jgi:hypothetical protein
VTAGLVGTVLAGALVASTVPVASAASSVAATPAAATAEKAPVPGTYKVSSFNVLGASHTPPGGRRASGVTRIGFAYELLRRHHVDVAGFQELQASQVNAFNQVTSGNWGLYPGLSLRRIDSENSIGWRRSKFDLVHATTVNIPYFDGAPRPMPVVLLREKSSGMLTYFANFHNPADTSKHRNQGRWRAEATRIEIALQNQLATRGIPRIMTGDMNERAPYFCRVTAGSPVKAARPTSYRKGGACYANKPRAVDWIFGSVRVTFSDYDEDRSPLVARTTDHPVITARVTVHPTQLPNAWAASAPTDFVPKVSYRR